MRFSQKHSSIVFNLCFKARRQRLIQTSSQCKLTFCDYFSPGKPCLASHGQFMLVLRQVTDLIKNKYTQEAIELSTGFSRRHRKLRKFSSFYSQRLYIRLFFFGRDLTNILRQAGELKPADQKNPVLFSFRCTVARAVKMTLNFVFAYR